MYIKNALLISFFSFSLNLSLSASLQTALESDSLFCSEYPEIIYIADLHIPDAIEVVTGEHLTSKIVAKDAYQPGDVLYEVKTLIFREDQVIQIQLNNESMLIDNLVHTVRRANSLREFYYFDSFMNHSCDPNTITFYTSENHYETRALKPILPGDEITCDYGVFDTDNDSDPFECKCGSLLCRGWIQ